MCQNTATAAPGSSLEKRLAGPWSSALTSHFWIQDLQSDASWVETKPQVINPAARRDGITSLLASSWDLVMLAIAEM